MRNTMSAGSSQKIAGRFIGAREHQRCAVEKRAQKNLQAAVPANVVEGAPNNGVSSPSCRP